MVYAEVFRTNEGGIPMALIYLHQSWLRACLCAALILLEGKKNELDLKKLQADEVKNASESAVISSQLDELKSIIADTY